MRRNTLIVNRHRNIIAPLCVLLLATATLMAQPVRYNHPELEWRSLELEHCVVHVHQGLEELGLVVADILEDVWDPVTELYDYVPDTKVHVVFYDTDDYSNGGAYFYNNKIIIWATSLDFDLRGQHNWLRNVVTHEFIHIIQLGASRKFPRMLPFVYLQGMGYEPEKRDDVLYGFPNSITSYPYPGTMVPAWFAEGTAQHQLDGYRYDYWDSQRDMVLRDRVLNGTLFDFHELEAFDKNTVDGESVYNQGFSLVNYIARNYGDESLQRISAELARPARVSMARAMESALGLDGRRVHEDWRHWLEQRYDSLLASVRGNEAAGFRISDVAPVSQGSAGRDELEESLPAPRGMRSCCAAFEGEAFRPPDELGPTNNLYPRVSADGRYVYYISNGDSDWLGQTALWRFDRRERSTEKLIGNVRGSFSLTPDDKAVVFSRRSPPDKHGRHLSDLYIYFLEEELTRRLTEHRRLTQPDVSPDGRSVICVRNGGGSRELCLVLLDSLDGPTWKELSRKQRKKAPKLEWLQVTDSPYGTQFFQPRWNPDGRRVAAARALHHGRDIVEVGVQSGNQRELLTTALDERYPQYSGDGRWLYYSSDATGIFNVYRLDLEGGGSDCLTNVIGCAFMPAAAGDTLFFSHYQDRGFRLHELAGAEPLPRAGTCYIDRFEETIPPLTYDDEKPTDREFKPQGNLFEKSFLIPRIYFDNREFKPGLYLLNTDVMERVLLTGSVAAARMNNLDLYASVDWALTRNTWFAEFYNLVRDEDQRFDDDYVITGVDPQSGAPVYDAYGVQYRFSLVEFSAGLRRRISDASTLEAAFSVSKYKARFRRPPALSVNYDYFKGRTLRLRWRTEASKANRVDDFINPRNRWWIDLELRRHWNRFIRQFEVTPAGLLAEVYDPAHFGDAELHAGRVWTAPFFPDLSLGLEGRGAWISDNQVDDFFYTYAGGLLGLQGYSYYSIGGTRKASARVRLGFPLVKRTGRRLGHLYFKRLYGAVFAGAGDAWVGDLGELDPKRELGAELRLYLDSWNMIPTAVTLTAAYGLDRFRVPELDPGETYGREWRWYTTVLFGFDQF